MFDSHQSRLALLRQPMRARGLRRVASVALAVDVDVP
jgi:hypothetical protein